MGLLAVSFVFWILFIEYENNEIEWKEIHVLT
jgi:hypothetical protein